MEKDNVIKLKKLPKSGDKISYSGPMHVKEVYEDGTALVTWFHLGVNYSCVIPTSELERVPT